jgi:hypothetical protein
MADQASKPLESQTVLELIFAIKSLAQTLEAMQEELKSLHEEDSRLSEKRHEKLMETLQANSLTLNRLPVDTADRTEQVLTNQVRTMLDETRRALDDVRMKLWMAVGTPRGPEASGSGMTVKDGVPVPIKEPDVTGQVTLLGDGKVQVQGKIDGAKVMKLWKIAKWTIASLAAAGGVAGIVRAILAITKNL